MKHVRPYVPKRARISNISIEDCKLKSLTPVSEKDDISCNDSPFLPAQCSKADNPEISNEHGYNSEQGCKVMLKNSEKNFIPRSCVANLKAHSNAVCCLRWSANIDLLISASLDNSIKLFDFARGDPRVTRTINYHTGAVKDVRWSGTGEEILSGGYDKYARITDMETGKETSSFKHKDFVTSVFFHPKNSNYCLSGTSSNGIYAWDMRSNQSIHHYKTFFGQVHDLLFHPDGKTFFSAAEILKRNSMDKAVIAWDFDTTAIMSNQISQEPYTCNCLQMHPFDNVFLAQYTSGYITIFSNSSPYKLNKFKRYEGHQTAGFRIGFTISPDGNKVISGDSQGKVHFYDYKSSKLLRTLDVFSSACMDVEFHPKLPNVLAMCSWDGEVSFWR